MPSPRTAGLIVAAVAATGLAITSCSSTVAGSAELASVLSPQTGHSGSAQPQHETAAVIETFEAYRQAVLNGDGDGAADLIAAESLDYYARVAELAATAGPDQFAELPGMDRLLVTLYRVTATPEQAAEMDGRTSYSFGVEQGLVNRETVANIKIETVSVDGTRATAPMVINGQATPFEFEFALAQGTWKLNVLPILEMSRESFAEVAERQGISEDELIFQSVAATTGEPVDESIFEKP